MTARRVLLYVQHLLGIGHFKRTATIATALTRAGMDVTLVSGGFEVPGMVVDAAHVVQLPPAGTADLSFKSLIDQSGNAVDAQWKQRRCDLLLAAWRRADPHVVVIELFPFGRRQMRFELLPLLDAAIVATHRPVIVSSVRDVLGGGQGDPARQEQMLALFEQYFDQLLVHGDPALIPFDRTFRHVDAIAARLHYTGYVVDRQPAVLAAGQPGTGEVMVSAGGGAVGRHLLETALRARPLSVLARHPWRVLAGSSVSQNDLAALSALAGAASGGGVVVERHRIDFACRLAHCRLSISQGGYNTIMETLHAGARAVIVPFAGGAETEQTLRARLLAERGSIDVVEEAELSPQSLAQAIDHAVMRQRVSPGAVNLDGARCSAELIRRWAGERPW